jgi:hypothetical protein
MDLFATPCTAFFINPFFAMEDFMVSLGSGLVKLKTEHPEQYETIMNLQRQAAAGEQLRAPDPAHIQLHNALGTYEHKVERDKADLRTLNAAASDLLRNINDVAAGKWLPPPVNVEFQPVCHVCRIPSIDIDWDDVSLTVSAFAADICRMDGGETTHLGSFALRDVDDIYALLKKELV